MDFVGARAGLSWWHAGFSHLSPFTYHPWSIIHLILRLMEEVLRQFRLVVSPIIYPSFYILVNRRIPSAIYRYTMVYIGVLWQPGYQPSEGATGIPEKGWAIQGLWYELDYRIDSLLLTIKLLPIAWVAPLSVSVMILVVTKNTEKMDNPRHA